MSAFEAVILGCGSSGGVPRADGVWGACDPADPRNRRSRCSLMVRRLAEQAGQGATTLVVDTSPDFRLQMVAGRAERLDAVLFSHDHADQVHGIDDIRAFALRQRARIDCYMDEATEHTLLRRFDYIFKDHGGYPAIANHHRLRAYGTAFDVPGPSGPIPVNTFPQDHGSVESVGFRFGGLAYSSDVVGLSQAAFDALADLDVWIVDALRWTPHPTHAHVDLALSWIERLKPRRAILTNLHIDLDYADLAKQLPAGVEPATDTMIVPFSA